MENCFSRVSRQEIVCASWTILVSTLSGVGGSVCSDRGCEVLRGNGKDEEGIGNFDDSSPKDGLVVCCRLNPSKGNPIKDKSPP